MIRLACSTASFPQEPVERALARVAWAGFEAVEMALPEQGLEGLDREELKARLRANELDVAAIHAGRLGARDAAEALEAAGRIGRAALLARELDGSRVVAEAPESGSMEHLAAGLVTLLQAMADLPVRIAVPNRAGSLLAAPEAMAELRRRVPDDRMELALDPAEARRAGWDPAALERLPEMPRYLYLNDLAGGEPAPPGEGELDWPGLAAALRAAGYDGFVTLRLGGAAPWSAEPAAREARAVAEEWLGLHVDAG